MFKYFDVSSERFLLWLEKLNGTMEAGKDLWKLMLSGSWELKLQLRLCIEEFETHLERSITSQ